MTKIKKRHTEDNLHMSYITLSDNKKRKELKQFLSETIDMAEREGQWSIIKKFAKVNKLLAPIPLKTKYIDNWVKSVIKTLHLRLIKIKSLSPKEVK